VPDRRIVAPQSPQPYIRFSNRPPKDPISIDIYSLKMDQAKTISRPSNSSQNVGILMPIPDALLIRQQTGTERADLTINVVVLDDRAAVLSGI
jgi:hypothetical protein